MLSLSTDLDIESGIFGRDEKCIHMCVFKKTPTNISQLFASGMFNRKMLYKDGQQTAKNLIF